MPSRRWFTSLLVTLLVASLVLVRSAAAQSTGVLLVAHGASAAWNAPVEAAAAGVRNTMPAEVGFLMGEGSTPQAAYDRLVARGVTRIVVVPLLISSHSAHAEQIRFLAGLRPDDPHAEHMVLTALKGTASIVGVTPAMDDDPIVGAILADRARALSRNAAHETLVIVAHGPNEDDEAALWTKNIARLGEHVKRALPFSRVDVRLLRDDAPKPVKDRALAELRESVATSASAGRVVVVPLLLSPGAVADEIPAVLTGLDYAWDGKTILPDPRVADWALARAQAAIASGEISGTVRDSSGAALPGASVVLRGKTTGLQRVERAGADGAFTFRGVATGEYEVVASLSGFAPVTLNVSSPQSRVLGMVLAPARYEESVTVVSDGRGDRLRGTTTVPVVVVDGQAMRDAADATVGEALRGVAGVVTRRGSEGAEPGGEQVQGVDSRQVLVLIDGQPAIGARGIKSGVIDLDRESTNGLDRVEIIKGAASALYGSDAMGGVINLIPRDPRRPLEVSGRAAGGDDGAGEVAGDVGARAHGAGVFVSAGHRERDAFDLTPTTADTTGAAFSRDHLLGRATFAPARSWLVTGTVTSDWNEQTGNSVGELGVERDQATSQSQTYGARANWSASANTSAEFRVYGGRYREDSTGVLIDAPSTALEPGDLSEDLAKIDASMSRLLGQRQSIRGGAEWSRDEYRGRNRIRDAQGDAVTTGVGWAQYELNPVASLTLTAGVRYDDHSIFGGATSPKVAAVQRVTPWLTARASYGRGFRAPDLGQLYYRFLNPTNLYQVIGNPALEPERSDSWQAGVESAAGSRARLGVNVFHNEVRQLIQAVSLGFVSTPGQLAGISSTYGIDPAFDVQSGRLLFLYENVARARTQGVELAGDVRPIAALRLSGSYTFLDAVDRATGAALSSRNRHQGAVRADWVPARTGVRVNLRGAFFSSWIAGTTRSVSGTSNIVAPGFALWDLTVAKTLVAGAEAFVAIDNLANSQDPNTGAISPTGAALPIYRPEIGRTWRAGFTWRWAR